MHVAQLPTRREDSDIASAQRVLMAEAEALNALAGCLRSTFSAALDLLERMRGRAIATGMGKSGHIAQKIAATLASTGTPASFVHPAEASHGDLGMITQDDVVVALSNSGETPELADVVTHAKRFDVPLIAVTKSENSALARASTIVLLLPAVAEACPLGLAPTTSTTMMMALGDCLAVSMLERRGFSPEDFRTLHPGGQLGQRLLLVSDLMHAGDALPVIGHEAHMAQALIAMTSKGFGCVGVIDDTGQLIGVVTDGDLRRHMSDTLTRLSVVDVMTTAPKPVRADALASEALLMMNRHSITSLFVLDDNRPCGILHVHDCLRAGIA